MTRQALRDKFVVVLTELGGSAGNGRLRDSLGWTEATYDAVKGELIDDGVVIPGRGRGGSVSVAGAEKSEAVQEKPLAPVRVSAGASASERQGRRPRL